MVTVLPSIAVVVAVKLLLLSISVSLAEAAAIDMQQRVIPVYLEKSQPFISSNSCFRKKRNVLGKHTERLRLSGKVLVINVS